MERLIVMLAASVLAMIIFMQPKVSNFIAAIGFTALFWSLGINAQPPLSGLAALCGGIVLVFGIVDSVMRRKRSR